MAKAEIKLVLERRPARIVTLNQKALFYGFNQDGSVQIELQNGQLCSWERQDVVLLDSHEKFDKFNWKGMGL